MCDDQTTLIQRILNSLAFGTMGAWAKAVVRGPRVQILPGSLLSGAQTGQSWWTLTQTIVQGASTRSQNTYGDNRARNQDRTGVTRLTPEPLGDPGSPSASGSPHLQGVYLTLSP